ncbi:MAG: O-methyltransferase [Actinomycetota bacterium]|nr:O-methyltransferase [Actinomycetota bacterium]
MSVPAFADMVADEPVLIASARSSAAEMGCPAIAPAVGTALATLATAVNARAVVEIGTGAGVSTLWLLAGMRPDGVLTSVDSDGEHQRAARSALVEADVPTARARLINGSAADVLPRLADGGYDLVFCDATTREYPGYLTHLQRILRPGGILAWHGLLWRDRVADQSARDPDTIAWRDLIAALRADPRVRTAVLPVGDGLLVAIRS